MNHYKVLSSLSEEFVNMHKKMSCDDPPDGYRKTFIDFVEKRAPSTYKFMIENDLFVWDAVLHYHNNPNALF